MAGDEMGGAGRRGVERGGPLGSRGTGVRLEN